jgi:hypothetical protein
MIRETFALVMFMVVLGVKPMTATPIIVNGGFQTGDFTGWTTFRTPNGLIGAGSEGLPAVVSVDATGSGASLAAEFDVGQIIFQGFGNTDQEGGGIFQDIATSAGNLTLYADIASFDNCQNVCDGNEDAGTYSLLLDGNLLASLSLGDIGTPQALRGFLNGSAFVSAGSHEVRIEITRTYQGPVGIINSVPILTENIDNLSAVLSPSPEPGSMMLLIIGLGGLVVRQLHRRADGSA